MTSSNSPRRNHSEWPNEVRRTAGAANVRAHNRELVLRLVWLERNISRAEIARRTGLSRSTVSNITAELFDTGVLRHAGEGPSIGGKPPKLLGFNDGVFGIIGVDMGASHVGVVLTDLRGKILFWKQLKHAVRDDPNGTIEKMFALIREANSNRPRGMSKAVGIGVAVPTPLDPSQPNVFSPRVLPEWRDTRLHDALSNEFGVDVIVDNDANFGALSERWWGTGANGDDLVFIKLGTGVGSGIILDGAIHRGARFLAGEIGHVAVDPNGPICDCGRRGCLVSFVGAAALIARTQQLAGKGNGPAPENLLAIISAAEEGDEIANQVLAEAAAHLAIAIWNLVNVMNPATVVLGGSLSRAGERLLVPISAALLSRWTSDAKTQLVVTQLGATGIALGAATGVLRNALADPSLFAGKVRA